MHYNLQLRGKNTITSQKPVCLADKTRTQNAHTQVQQTSGHTYRHNKHQQSREHCTDVYL